MSLSEFERITLLMMRGYGYLVRPYEETAHLFSDTFLDRPPINLKKLEQSKIAKEVEGPNSVTDEQKSLDVLQTFVENPSTSARVAAEDLDMSHTSVLNVLHKNKYHPFKGMQVRVCLKWMYEQEHVLTSSRLLKNQQASQTHFRTLNLLTYI
ncbi:hypothetical protein J6590_062307 [Homalodisca vitripennis]|nr:hypothetical protein J6590_062307 [Homalodisca vitripennis]